jgi:hypothetical protein
MSNATVPDIHLRPSEKVALDAAAFHYTVYRALTRFLGYVSILNGQKLTIDYFLQHGWNL